MYTFLGIEMRTGYDGPDDHHHGVGHMGSSSGAWKIRVVEKRCPSFNIQHIMKIHLLGFPI